MKGRLQVLFYIKFVREGENLTFRSLQHINTFSVTLTLIFHIQVEVFYNTTNIYSGWSINIKYLLHISFTTACILKLVDMH